MLLLALLLLLLACLLREAYREVTSSVVSGLKEVCSKVWECVVLKEAYQDAVDGYLIAAGEDVETQHENGKSAGRGIKHYLKDLWTAFILVVSSCPGCADEACSQRSPMLQHGILPTDKLKCLLRGSEKPKSTVHGCRIKSMPHNNLLQFLTVQ